MAGVKWCLSGVGCFFLAVSPMADAATAEFRADRISLNGEWRFQLRRDNQLTGTGPVRFGPVSASSQAVMIEPWPGETAEGRWHTSVPWPVSVTLLDSAPGGLASRQIWKPHQKQVGETWWRADLEREVTIQGVHIHWVKPGVVSVGTEVSIDGSQWSKWASATSKSSEMGTAIRGTPIKARYLRLVFSPSQFDGTRRINISLAGPGGESVSWYPRVQKVWYEELRRFTPADGFQRPDFSDADWKTIQVPGYWEVQRFSEPTWWQPDDAVGCYRRSFTVPQGWSTRQVRLRFEGVNNGAQIWINGHEVGYHESGFTAFEYDVTPHLRFDAENLIAVRVTKWTLTHEYDTDDVWFLGGIWRDIYLYSLPSTRIDDYWIRTEFDRNYRHAVLRVRADLRAEEPSRCTVEGELLDEAGKTVPIENFRAQLAVAGREPAPVELSAVVESPRQWTAETPCLYSLLLRLRADGATVQEFRTPVGFREVVVKGHSILLNGVPLKIRGVVTTRANPNDAGESRERIFAREIRLLKEANINAIRSHTTPLEEEFLDLCDRHGIYVIPDVPEVWVNEYDFRYLTDGNILRGREIFEQHKNRASVIAWHIGNENGQSSAFLGMGRAAMWLHDADPSRPVMICQNRADLTEFGTAVNDQHYNPLRHAEFRDPTPAPVLFGEFHALPEEIARLKDRGFVETWGRSLLLEWTEFQKRPWVAGGLICCWDDGSVNGNLGPRQWGVVDSTRHAKDIHFHIRKVFAPVRLSLLNPEIRNNRLTGVLVVANRYSFTDLDGYRFEWKLITADKVLNSGTYSWRVAPGETGEFQLSLAVPAHPELLEVSIFDRQGYSIQEESFRLPAAGVPSDIGALLAKIGVKREAQLALSNNEVKGRNYVGRLAGAARIEINDRKGRPVMSIGGAVLQKGRSRQRNVPFGQIEYGSPRIENNNWIVPVSAEGRIAGVIEVAFGPRWMSVSCELESRESQAIRESGIELDLAPELSRLTWNRDALWNKTPPGWADGTLESVEISDFATTISRRRVRWAMVEGKDRVLLFVPNATYTNIRAGGDAGMLVLSDYLGAGDFLGKFDRATIEKSLAPGEKITGGFTVYFVTPEQATRLHKLPVPAKDLTWAARMGSNAAIAR